MGYNSNIKNFIEKMLDDNYLIDNTLLYHSINNTIIPQGSILFSRYAGYLLSNSIDIELDDKLFSKFKYNPKLLSQKLYGTTTLWYVILWINKLTTITEFNKKNIKVFNPDKLSELNDILVTEEDTLKNNHYNNGI